MSENYLMPTDDILKMWQVKCNEQQAEIERLRDYNNKLADLLNDIGDKYNIIHEERDALRTEIERFHRMMVSEKERDMLNAAITRKTDVINGLRTEIERLQRELQLAISHDRQPYPTAYAYETVCKALQKEKDKLERVREWRDSNFLMLPWAIRKDLHQIIDGEE